MKEYLAYTHKSTKVQVFVLFISFVFLLCGVFLITRQSFFTGIVLIGLGVLTMISIVTEAFNKNKLIKAITSSDEFEDILSDFNTATSFSDEAIIGYTYIFRRYYLQPLRLSDVMNVSLSIKDSGENSRNKGVYLKLRNGKEERLCGIYGPNVEEQYMEIYETLKNRGNF